MQISEPNFCWLTAPHDLQGIGPPRTFSYVFEHASTLIVGNQ
jgi:hypothetical protein